LVEVAGLGRVRSVVIPILAQQGAAGPAHRRGAL